ncbi:MAG: hypothetical protein MK011_08770 [Dehalococcoidia bacterium]|nr:hypothetical protein [Dehalococcoidia bacterium]
MVDYESLDDHQLMHRIYRADKTALEALYTRYHTPVYSLAMFMLKQPTLVSMNTPRLVTYSPKSQFTR